MATFGEAIQGIKAGKWARRAGWNGKGMHIYLEDGWTDEIHTGALKGRKRDHAPYIVMFTAQGIHQPGWLASQPDMLSDDWEVFDPS